MSIQPSKPRNPIDTRTRIGHIHLKVSNLERSVKFYRDILGFEVTSTIGNEAAFLSAGGYHHHIGLNTWESKDGHPPSMGTTGLYHFAILLPERKELARVLKRLNDNRWPIEGGADHGVSEAIYLRDPDQNGIELYVDRMRIDWPRDENGVLTMYTRPLDIKALLKEAE